MKRSFSLFIIAVALNVCVAQARQKSDFDVERLSARGREAYQKLRAADIFSVGGVGYAAETSEGELALYALLDEEAGLEALRSLARDDSYEGGLYGLLGLRIKEAEAFNRAAGEYKSRGEPPERKTKYWNTPKGKVTRQAGCIIFVEDWGKVIRDLESGAYDEGLKKRLNHFMPGKA